MRILAATFLLALCTLPIQAGDPGRVSYQRLAAPELDRYTNNPSRAQQQWFRTHFARMVVFTTYFDSRTSWYPNALVYANLYGVFPDSPSARQHGDWILHDPRGNWLYIPFNCTNGTCPQYAGDITNPRFRAAWIDTMRKVLARGYRGLFIDDVNTEFRVSDGRGTQVPPIDSATGQPMTWDAWRNYVAGFVEQIRQAFPKAEIEHNSIWFAGPNRDADPAIQRQIKAADNIFVERGIASDPGLTGGTGPWSVHELFSYIDRIHAAGRAVSMGEYFLDRPAKEYALAGYFMISEGNDHLGDAGTNPTNWWSGYDVDLGKPIGRRTYHDGVFQRQFSCGTVLLGEPGLKPQKIELGAAFKTLDGRSVRSVDLSGRQGLILLRCPAEQETPTKANPTSPK